MISSIAILLIAALLFSIHRCANADVLTDDWQEASMDELVQARKKIGNRILERLEGNPAESMDITTEGKASVPRFNADVFQNKNFCDAIITSYFPDTDDDVGSIPEMIVKPRSYGLRQCSLRPVNKFISFGNAVWVYPTIVVDHYGEKDELPAFAIVIDFCQAGWSQGDIRKIEVELGNTTYMFDFDAVIRDEEDRAFYHEPCLLIDNDAFKFLMELYQCDKNVIFHVFYSDEMLTLNMEDMEGEKDLFLSDVKRMYNAMEAAGGFNPSFLYRVPLTYELTVKQNK